MATHPLNTSVPAVASESETTALDLPLSDPLRDTTIETPGEIFREHPRVVPEYSAAVDILDGLDRIMSDPDLRARSRLITHAGPDPDAFASMAILHAAIKVVYGHDSKVLFLGEATNPNLAGLYDLASHREELDTSNLDALREYLKDKLLIGTDIHTSSEPNVRMNLGEVFPQLFAYLDHHFARPEPPGGILDVKAGSAVAITISIVESLFERARKNDPANAMKYTLDTLFAENPGLATAAFAAVMTDETEAHFDQLLAGNYSSVAPFNQKVLSFLRPSSGPVPIFAPATEVLATFDTTREPEFNNCFRQFVELLRAPQTIEIAGVKMTVHSAVIGAAGPDLQRYFAVSANAFLASRGDANPVVLLGIYETPSDEFFQPFSLDSIPEGGSGQIRYFIRTSKKCQNPEVVNCDAIAKCLVASLPDGAGGGGRETAGRVVFPPLGSIQGKPWDAVSDILGKVVTASIYLNLPRFSGNPASIDTEQARSGEELERHAATLMIHV